MLNVEIGTELEHRLISLEETMRDLIQELTDDGGLEAEEDDDFEVDY